MAPLSSPQPHLAAIHLTYYEQAYPFRLPPPSTSVASSSLRGASAYPGQRRRCVTSETEPLFSSCPAPAPSCFETRPPPFETLADGSLMRTGAAACARVAMMTPSWRNGIVDSYQPAAQFSERRSIQALVPLASLGHHTGTGRDLGPTSTSSVAVASASAATSAAPAPHAAAQREQNSPGADLAGATVDSSLSGTVV
ncbi:hypothetical protein ACCO45_014012 [Purpureocillium lilacinum]|uniref:Uncharacterized protein n=1 Tax=Purpureocillium lilacinum TaxID=33203 RepID=A0ACC4DAH4_PURLI